MPKTVSGVSAPGPESGWTPRSRASWKISGATQVGACTPLVIEVIGRSSASNIGQSPPNMPRLT